MSAGTNREKIKAIIHLTYINSAKVQIGKNQSCNASLQVGKNKSCNASM